MRRFLISAAAFAGVAVATTACDTTLFDASLQNVVDTVSVGSLVGTPLTVPSGYALNFRRAVRTDSTSSFDFAYTILPDGRRVLLPLAALGLGAGVQLLPGLLASDQAFDAIREAPLNGYRTRDTIPVAPGNVFFARSGIVCGQFGVPKYAKLEVLDFDEPNRLIRFRIMVNQNCGFRGLQPGIPEN